MAEVRAPIIPQERRATDARAGAMERFALLIEKIAQRCRERGGSSTAISSLADIRHLGELTRAINKGIERLNEICKQRTNGEFNPDNAPSVLDYFDELLLNNTKLTRQEKVFAQSFMIYYTGFPPGVREDFEQCKRFLKEQPEGRVYMKLEGKKIDVGTFIYTVTQRETEKGDSETAVATGMFAGQYMAPSSALFWGYLITDPRQRHQGHDAHVIAETVQEAGRQAEARGKKLEWVVGEAEIPVKKAVIDQLGLIKQLHEKHDFSIGKELPAKAKERINLALKENPRLTGVNADDILNAVQALVSANENERITDPMKQLSLEEASESLKAFSVEAVGRLRNFEKYGITPLHGVVYYQPSIDGEQKPVPLFLLARSMEGATSIREEKLQEILVDTITRGPYVVDPSAPKHLQSHHLLPEMFRSFVGKGEIAIGRTDFSQYYGA